MTYDTPREIADAKQLLYDDALTGTKQGFATTLNPAMRTEGPVLLAEKPWEYYLWVWLTVMQDGLTYKMWYDAYGEDRRSRLCYAESKDGIHWEKPDLGLIAYKGCRHNNIVFEGASGLYLTGTVFKAPPVPSPKHQAHTPPSDRLFRYVYGDAPGERQGAIKLAYSPDGLRWTVAPGERIAPGIYDAQNVCFWDDRIGRHVLIARLNNYAGTGDSPIVGRSIGRSESEDIENFPPLTPIIEPDEDDRRGAGGAVTDFYNQAVMKYPFSDHAYFLLASAYHHDPPHTMDVQLFASRNGVQWTRWREPFVRLGQEGAFDSRRIYMGAGALPVHDELWLYYGGLAWPHMPHPASNRYRPYPAGFGGIGRVRVRLDGFISQDAPQGGGVLATVPLTFTGSRLVVNMDGSAGGWLKTEILDGQGTPVPGFSENDADPLWGNDVRKLVTWKERSDLSALRGKPVRLRFVGRSVKLYAFQFAQGAARNVLV